MGERALSAHEAAALRSTPLFANLAERDLARLAALSRIRHLPARASLFEEGAACSAFYVLLDGFVELERRGPDGEPRVVEFVEPGETFAEAAMFSGQGYPVSATALLDSRLIEISAYRFLRFLQANPQVGWAMLANLSRRLHQLVGHLAAASVQGAEQKVAAYLLAYGESGGGERWVGHLPNRRKDLAKRIGLSAESLCRVLGSFRARGWIATEDASRIRLLDVEALEGLLRTGPAPSRDGPGP